jgi:DedD protein
MAEALDVDTLRRRGRRRLVGAIALVLLAAIVLPMVFDQEPKSGLPPVSVRIPSEDDTRFPSKAVPVPPPETPPAAPAAPARAPTPAPNPTAAASGPAKAPAAHAAPSGEQFVVQLAALANAEKVKALVAQLNAAHLPHYTEPVTTAEGTVTRVRVGPFGTREAAEDAQRRLQRLGLESGKVLPKS